MSLLVVSQTVPDAPANNFDFRRETRLRELHANQLEPISYPALQPSVWASAPGPHLLHPNLDDIFVQPWLKLYASHCRYSADILFDLRRYRGMVPETAILFFKFATSSSSFCMAPDHELLHRICGTGARSGIVRLYTEVGLLAAAQRSAVA